MNIDVDEIGEYCLVQVSWMKSYGKATGGLNGVRIGVGVDTGADVEGIGFEYYSQHLNRR